MKKFPDFVAPTKVTYLDRGTTLHLRRCSLTSVDDPRAEWEFEKEEVRIGSMDDNDIVLRDDTVSRYHCKIVQEDTSYLLVDLGSTNGTFINGTQLAAKVRTKVNPGDRIRFDTEEFETRAVSPEAPADDNRTVLREAPADFAKTVMVSRPVHAPTPAAPAPVPAVPAAPIAPAGEIPGGWDAGSGVGTVLIDTPVRAVGAIAADDGPAGDMSDPHLYVVTGKKQKQRIRLVSDESGKSAWTIGSRADQTLRFEDDGVSAEHAKLSTDGQRWVLTDRITTNGTYVNGKRVPMAWLSSGDRLQFGPVECVFHMPRSGRGVFTPGGAGTSGAAGGRNRTPIFIAVAASFVVTLVVIYFLFRRH